MLAAPLDIRVEPASAGIVRVTLTREKQLNAYSMRMCRELLAAISQFDRDDDARVLVITGAGRSFCAGGDVSGADPEHDE